MAIVATSPDSVTAFIGLSSDTKPTSATPGSTYFETDTGGVYITNGTGTWYALPALGAPGGGDASAANQAVTNTDLGAPGDASVAAGATGSVSAKLRRLTTDLSAFLTANHTDLGTLATQTTLAAVLAALVEGGELDIDLDALHTDLVALIALNPALGQALMAASVPVVIASDQSALSIKGRTIGVSVTPTLTVHATYVSGDYVGTSATPMTFAGMGRANGGAGVILSAEVIDLAVQSLALELWLFDTAITPPADSAAWSVSDADIAHCVGVIAFGTYYASALNSVASVGAVSMGYKCAVADTALYGCLVTRGAPTYASGDITVSLKATQD